MSDPVPLFIKTPPHGTGVCPKGMRIKKMSGKTIAFNKAMRPAVEFYEGLPLKNSRAVITDVSFCFDHRPYCPTGKSKPVLYPQFQTCIAKGSTKPQYIAMCEIYYEATTSSGKRYPVEVILTMDNPLDSEVQKFFDYLDKNGIHDWDDLIGCEELVSIEHFGYYPHIIMTDHQFICEPKGGGGNAKRR